MIDAKTLRLVTHDGLLNFAAGHVLDGIAALRTLLSYCPEETILRADTESLEKNYHYMLTFLRKGGNDKKRGEVQAKIRRWGVRLLLQASRAIRTALRTDRYGKAWAALREGFGPDAGSRVVEAFRSSPFKGEPEGDRQDDLFDLLWTSPLWTPQDTAFWYDFILGQRDMVQQHLSGALFLSAWEYCDPEKAQLLGLLADSECRRTRITAVTYLLLLRLRHKELAPMLPPLPASLRTKKGRKLAAQVQYEMLLMLVSERDMKQELDEIGSFSHDVISGKKALDTDILKAFLETRGRHLRNRLQRGLDPNLSKTVLLHNCKYLNRVSHWFLPFDKNHPLFQSVMIDEKGNEKQTLSTLVDLILDCDIDKMATLWLASSDKDFRQAISHLDSQELPDLEGAIIPEYTFRFIMQDLYRFFLHSPLHAQLANPFREKQALLGLPELSALIPPDDQLASCSLLIEIGRAEQALGIIDSLIGGQGATAPALTLKGQALMHLKRYPEAQGCLRSAEILQPDDAGVLRLLAECYAATHRYEEELEYLQRLAALLPDDDTCRRLIPATMNKAGRHEEALQLLFKLDYEADGSDPAVVSSIADTALALGKLDVAERYTEKEADTWKGALRMGHIRMMQGDWKDGTSHYGQFVNTYCKEREKDISAALSLLESQWRTLRGLRENEADLLLVRDILQDGAGQGSSVASS